MAAHKSWPRLAPREILLKLGSPADELATGTIFVQPHIRVSPFMLKIRFLYGPNLVIHVGDCC